MKTKRLIILKRLPIFSWKRSQLCNYKYVIPRKVLKTGSHVRCKCKRKRKWKCKRVHTFNANARKERYASARSIFPRWPTMIELLPIHTCGKRTQILAQEDENVFITWVDACVCVCICVGWFTRSIPCICNCVLLRSPGVIDWQREVWVLILSLS